MAKILCIEDEIDLREDIVDELRQLGHEVLEAENGQEGLDIILNCNPDLVISDITMPVMGGLELLKALREKYPHLVDLPFIFLSALANREDVILGRKLGADDYLTKPVDYDMLQVTVDSRLNRVVSSAKKKEGEMVALYKELTRQAGPALSASSQAPDTGIKVEELPEGRFLRLNLEEIQTRYADRWQGMLGRVDEMAVRVIKGHLSAGDIFRHGSPGNYLLCFSSLSETEAQYKAAEVKRDILKIFLGTDAD